MAQIRSNNKRILTLVIVLSSFFAGLLIIGIAIDIFILPAMIHSGSKVQVPNLKGKSINQAKQMLLERNLAYEMSRAQYSDKYPPDIVLSQDPRAGLWVKEGRAIYITQSKGKEKMSVPYVRGLPLRSARVTLLREGLELGSISYVYHDSIDVDIVIDQKVSSGEQMSYGTKVDLIVSKGPANIVLVPNLLGTSLADAIELLLESGLELGEIKPIRDGTFEKNTIIEQSPQAGEIVQLGSSVTISITK